MQLERKLRDALNTPGSGDLEKSLSSSLQSLEASNAELERCAVFYSENFMCSLDRFRHS